MTRTSPFNPISALKDFMGRFLVFSDDSHADIVALWILHTWAFDAAYATPYLYVNSAEPQSGKTRTLEICEMFARNAISNSNTSTAAMFRLIEDQQPTLFLDEVDTVFHGAANEELRGVLNSGYKSGGSVMRFDGKEPVSFSTFCPKMLVGIDNGAMPDTLKDRCIPIVLKRKRTDQAVERFIPRKIEADAKELKSRLQKWASDNLDSIMAAPDPKPIDGISDRSFEICEPLLILARVAGGAAYDKTIRKQLLALLAGHKPRASLGVRILQAAKDHFQTMNADKMSSAQLAQAVGVTPKKLGVELARYDITPSTLRFPSGDKLKGYVASDFADAWARYL